jgi:cellulose synthase/poly-beta-1,6-N-acetylglucosamine synthase-like glycosyltransferase
VVTTDANALADPGMVKNLVRHFSDPAVGGVTGDKCILPPQTGFLPEQDEHTYWSYENRLKENEYRVFGSMLSCDNVIFALRKVIFTDPCPPIIGHDFWLSLYISRKGFRIAYDHEAKVFEQYTASLGLDFQRKQRVILGGLQALRLFPDLVWSFRRPGLAFQLASHKILRWLASVLMLALFTVNSLLAGNPLYDLALGLQILFYAVFLTGFLFRGTLHWKPVKLITYFVSVNAASLVALFQYFTRPGNRNPFWEKARA